MIDFLIFLVFKVPILLENQTIYKHSGESRCILQNTISTNYVRYLGN